MRLPLEYAVRNLGRSHLRLALILASAALVALLATSGVGFVRGMQHALGASALPNNIILLGAGSEESLERSEISPQVATIAATSVDGIASAPHGPDGVAYVSPEVHVALPLTDEHGEKLGPTAVFRGITPTAHLVHPQVRIVDGRAPEPGADEIMLGTEAAEMLRRGGVEASIGSSMPLGAHSLTIVGVFSAPGTALEGEIWMPLTVLKNAMQRTTDSCVVLALAPNGDRADVEAFAATRVDLELVALSETEYYAALAQFLAPVRWLVIATAAIIAFGGLLGGVSAMDAAFASRLRELGTLQAIGFSRAALAASFVQESLLASTSGALIAALVALLIVDGVAVRSSMGVFALTIDAPSVAAGFAAALVLGLAGALVPALRCLRIPVTDALKASI